MIILGLNDSNSAAAVIRDGQLVAAAREERFTRIKFDDAFPINAVDYCLKAVNVKSIKEVDKVVFAWNPGHELEPQDSAAAVRYHKHFLHYIPNNLLRHIGGDKSNKRISGISQTVSFLEGEMDVHFLPHHRCHAASAFFISPYRDATILTIDAYGDDITTEFFYGKDNRLQTLKQTLFPHSMGQLYAGVTQYLGYRANSDEWKVMGMAPYGNQEYYDKFAGLFWFDKEKGQLRVNLEYFSYYIWGPRRYSDDFIELLGPERHRGEELTERHFNIAASFQKRVEDVVLEMCDFLYKETGTDTLCIAGGVGMNSKMNGRIYRETPFTNVWVQPGADDGGTSIGACFYYWNQVLGNPRTFTMTHDYWGPGFSNGEIKRVLDDALVDYSYVEDIEREAAEAVAAGKVIGWFQGRMEAAQRALGNRSIIGDPRDPDMKDKINKLVKHRESYRPFAPSVLAEYQNDYFDNAQVSPYMQMVFSIKEDKRSVIPAVTHIDGTGRQQTVQKDVNPRYWKMIDEFRKITGIGLVLNTSFNDNNEPIVCTPKEALRTFFSTGLQELYIGNYKLTKAQDFKG